MTLKEAEKAIGIIVEVHMGVWGNYIGELLSVKSSMCEVADVKILACTRYPSQRAIFFKDCIFERMPLVYGSIEPCLLDIIDMYYGPVPDYHEQMRKAILMSCDMDKKLYTKHCKYWGIA